MRGHGYACRDCGNRIDSRTRRAGGEVCFDCSSGITTHVVENNRPVGALYLAACGALIPPQNHTASDPSCRRCREHLEAGGPSLRTIP